MTMMIRASVVAGLLFLLADCGGRAPTRVGQDAGADAAGADGAAGDAAAADRGQTDGLRGDTAPRPDAGEDAATDEDAGPSPDGGTYGIACGLGVVEICTPGTQLCCVISESPPESQCIAKSTVGPHCVFGANCDGPEDCGPDGSCCAPSGGIMQTYCAVGPCPAGDTLCHTPADCPNPGDLCCGSIEFSWPHSQCFPASPGCPG